MIPRFASPQARSLFVLACAFDPALLRAFRRMVRMNARRIRPDAMLVRKPDGTYDQLPDPGAWNAAIPMMVSDDYPFCVLRRPDGEWTFHS